MKILLIALVLALPIPGFCAFPDLVTKEQIQNEGLCVKLVTDQQLKSHAVNYCLCIRQTANGFDPATPIFLGGNRYTAEAGAAAVESN